MLNKILVVLTPQHQGPAPLKHAIRIVGGIEGTSLRLLYIIPRTKVLVAGPPPPAGASIPIRLKDPDVYRDTIGTASTRLEEINEVCKKADIVCASDILIGRRGYLTAEIAALCHLVVCEKRPRKTLDGRYRRISLSEIARLARTPVLAVPEDYTEATTIQTAYDDSLRARLLLGFSIYLAQVLAITLRVVLVDSMECRAEDIEETTAALLADFLPASDSDIVVAGKAGRMMDRFGDERGTITAVSPGWYQNFKHFGLSRNKVVHAFKGPVAIVP